jgi:hypothetical protein
VTEYVGPVVGESFRVMLCGGAEPAWYQESDADRRDRVLPAILECFRRIRDDLGLRLLVSFDDDFLMCGTPRSRPWSFYVVYEASDLTRVVTMVDLFRTAIDGVRLDRYFHVEALVGREFFPAER